MENKTRPPFRVDAFYFGLWSSGMCFWEIPWRGRFWGRLPKKQKLLLIYFRIESQNLSSVKHWTFQSPKKAISLIGMPWNGIAVLSLARYFAPSPFYISFQRYGIALFVPKNGLILRLDMYCEMAYVFNILSVWQLCGTRTEPWNPCGICGRKYVCLQISQCWPVADLPFCGLILCFYSEMFMYLSFWFCDVVFLKVNIWLFVVVSLTPFEGEIEKSGVSLCQWSES